MPLSAEAHPTSSEGPVLSKAVLRAASQLQVSGTVLSNVIGLSEVTVSRMRRGEFLLERGSKEFELGVLFARLYRSLDANVGGDDAVAKAWIRNDNLGLGGRPIDKIQTIAGLTDVIAYLDARRARV